MSKLEDALKRLTPEQRALLERKLQEKRQQAPRRANSISRRANPATYPLSQGQQRLLLQERLIPGTAMFNIVEAVELRGPVDIGLFEQSVLTVLERHAVLRCRFAWEKNKPIQWIEPIGAYSLPFVDLSDASEEEAFREALALAGRDYTQPFDLEHTGPIRCRMLKVADRRHVFTMTMHHTVTDAWSFAACFKEIAAAYAAFRSDQVPDLPLPELEYADYAAWQTEWLSTQEADERRAWWAEYLAGQPEPLLLPTDRGTGPTTSFAAASRTAVLPPALTQVLRTLSIEEEVTPFVLFLSGFALTLHRMTRQEDLIVCAPFSGRRREELEPIVGYFNNILPLRTRIARNDTVDQVVHHVARSAVEVNDRQEIPFQQVADLPSVRRIPLTRAFFTLQHGLSEGFTLPDVTVAPIALPAGSTNFDLALYVELKATDVALQLDFRTGAFSERAIDRLIEALFDTLGRMASAFRAPVSGWPALSPPAGDGGHAAAPAASLPEAHVELVPGSIAASLPGGDSIPRHVDARRPLTRTAHPTDEMEIALTQIWETVLGIAHIGPNENFFDLGGHSLLAVALFEEIQRRYPEVQLPLAALLEAPTVASLAERLRGKGGDAWSPLVVIQAGRESTPLFCVHGAGGNVLFYRDLAVHMGPDQTVYGLQAQGLDGERPILTRVEDMAERYVREILRVQPNGPYYLVGYCLGGTIAFEIAQQLRAKGLETGFVAMLETYNWIKAVPETPWSRLRYQVQKIEFHLRNILQLSGEERRMFFREKLAELKRRRRVWTGHWFGRFRRASAPSRIEGPAGDALARVWAANDQAAEAYQPSAYPGRILHFRPVKEYNVNRPREMGWEGIVRQVDTHILPIFPAGMLIPPFVKQVAQVLRAELHKRRQDLRRLSQTPELPDTHA